MLGLILLTGFFWGTIGLSLLAAVMYVNFDSSLLWDAVKAGFLAGEVGASIHGLQSLGVHLRDGKLDLAHWWHWYLQRPIIGGPLATGFAFTLAVFFNLGEGKVTVSIAIAAGMAAGMSTEKVTATIKKGLDRLTGGK